MVFLCYFESLFSLVKWRVFTGALRSSIFDYWQIKTCTSLLYHSPRNLYSREFYMQSCLVAVKEKQRALSPGAANPKLGFSSQLVVSTVFSAKATMLSVLAPVLQCIWLSCSSIWAPRSSSWRVTLLVTTRRQESSPVIFSWLSVMTRSWTNCSPVSPLHREVFFPKSRLFCFPRRPRRNPKLK